MACPLRAGTGALAVNNGAGVGVEEVSLFDGSIWPSSSDDESKSSIISLGSAGGVTLAAALGGSFLAETTRRGFGSESSAFRFFDCPATAAAALSFSSSPELVVRSIQSGMVNAVVRVSTLHDDVSMPIVVVKVEEEKRDEDPFAFWHRTSVCAPKRYHPTQVEQM